MHKETGTIPDSLNRTISKALDSYPLTEAYKRYSLEHQLSLLFQLTEDPVFKKAKQNWSSYDKYQKLYTLQHIANLHAQEFSYPKTRVEFYNSPPQIDQVTGKNRVSLGFYDWVKRPSKIKVNENEQSGGLETFGQALNTTLHECTHALQDHLAMRFERGSLGKDDPLYEQAQFFLAGRYVYVTHEQSEEHYLNNLLEQDAFAFGYGTSFYLSAANDKQREVYVRRLTDNLRGIRNFDINILKDLHSNPPSSEIG